MIRKSQLSSKPASKRIVTAFAAIATTAVVGTAGIASAAQLHSPSSGPMSVNQFCKTWKHYNFKNHGDCVSWWHKHKHGQGHGYGGNGNGNNVSTGVNVNVNGNNNVISVVINYFFGH